MAFSNVDGAFSGLSPSQYGVTDVNSYADVYGFEDSQFLPDIYEQEVTRYGKRTLSNFLRMLAAEYPSNSGQIRWSEQGRLHIAYDNAFRPGAASTRVFTIQRASGNDSGDFGTGKARTGFQHAMRVGNVVLVGNADDGTSVSKAVVTAVANGTSVELSSYTNRAATDDAGFPGLHASGSAGSAATHVSILVIGSEFGKGTEGMTNSVEAEYETYTNNHTIIKDAYRISGSDTAQIGWIEGQPESGSTGFYWFLKSENETRLRFEDYLESQLLEAKVAETSTVNNRTSHASAEGLEGTQGLFDAITDRGNTTSGSFFVRGMDDGDDFVGAFDAILKRLDKEGTIEENMLYLNRDESIAIDDGLATQNGYYTNGTTWGVFDNDKDMALNLGFTGFRRGSYDFYKTDWKYLNQADGRGLFSGDIKGVSLPMGMKSVYDEQLGMNMKRPFLHIRYRASEHDNRKMKSWITGSVGGAYTDSLDAMEVHFLSERSLITQAANNFFLFTS